MFSPEKEFHRLVIETLGKEGKSISSLAKELEAHGYGHHRLILTGYLRALTDMNILKEREVPPAKVYTPIKQAADSIYERIGRKCREISNHPEDLIIYSLNRLFKRAVFENELKMAGVMNPPYKEADEDSVSDARRLLKKSGVNVPSNQPAFLPDEVNEGLESELHALMESLLVDCYDFRHLVLDTRQTRLI